MSNTNPLNELRLDAHILERPKALVALEKAHAAEKEWLAKGGKLKLVKTAPNLWVVKKIKK